MHESLLGPVSRKKDFHGIVVLAAASRVDLGIRVKVGGITLKAIWEALDEERVG